MSDRVLLEVSKRVIGHLQFLYGNDVAGRLAEKLQILYREYGDRIAPEARYQGGLALTEKDAVLICYPDQVQEPDRSPLATLTDFAREYLRDVVSGIHLLPFYPSSSDDGFAVKDYLAVEPSYGTWNDVKRLKVNFDLMFDAVFNHLSASSSWFKRFLAGDRAYRDYFITVEGHMDLSNVIRPRTSPLLTEFQTAGGPKKVWTTFSADQVDLNFKNPEVLMAMIEVLLFYLSKGARFIRLDAIAFLWKEIGTNCLHLPQTHRIVQLIRAILDDIAPHVLLVTETNVPHLENISYFGDGTNEAQLVYNFALPPLVLHSLHTGNSEKLTRWAQSLSLPSKRTTFFNFLASHDGIGLNPARGILSEAEIQRLVDTTICHGGLVSYKTNSNRTRSPYELNISWFDALNDAPNEPQQTQVKRFMVSQAILLTLAGVPGIYFHSLFGARNDRAAAETSGIPRRINRQKLQRAVLENELASPATIRSQVFAQYCELLNVRRKCPAFHPLSQQTVLKLDPRVFAILRTAPEGNTRMLCLHNITSQPVSIKHPWFSRVHWVNAFPEQTRAIQGRGSVDLGPFEILWLLGGPQGQFPL